MNSMDLIKAFSYIDDDLVFDAANDSAQPQKSTGIVPVKQPKHNKPQRGGAKAKAILIGALACVCVAAMVCAILYFTGVFDIKQIPIYQGMEISSVAAESSQSDKSAASYSYSGDYVGKGDDVDNETPFGDDSATLEQEAQSTLSVAGAGESIYYADADDDIYITIKFSNPDSFEILSFVINGEKYTNYMFQTGSDLENIIIKVNVGSVGGIIEYTISEIKYVDGTEIKDVTMEGDPVVKCGVRTSDITYASISDEEVTFTSISFTAEIVDLYSLVEYSGGYLKAVLYDGESLAQIADLEVGNNYIKFTNLTPNTLYQYAIVGYYDNLSGDGVALNYLYTNALYTTAVVLFDNIEVGQESIAFDYNWAEGYESQITSLTLTGGGATQNLSASATSATGLLSDTDYTLTATYSLAGGGEDSISIEFTTLAKTAPELSVEFVDSTASSLTFSVDYTDTDGVGSITAIELYNGTTLVKSVSNLNSGEYTFSGLSAYTEYTIKVVYSYNLNNGTGTGTVECTLAEYTDPVVELISLSHDNSSAVTEGGTIYLTANVNNPSGVTYNSVVVNGVTYTGVGGSKGSTLYVDIINDGQFTGGTTTLTITQINCSIDGKNYTIKVTENNTTSLFIYGTLTVEDYTVVRYNATTEQYEQTYYGFPNEQLYYQISLNNETGYTIDSVTIENTTYTSSSITMADDMQAAYITLDDGAVTSIGSALYVSTTLNSISYSYGEDVSKTSPANASAYYVRLASDETIYISSAEDFTTKINGDKCYYVLTQDIDLSGYEWVNMGISVSGVFDGNGHTISGMGAKTTYENTDLNIGLFSEADAIIINLNLVADYRITLNDSSTTSRSINIYGIGGSLFDNVSVDMSVVLTTNANIGGISVSGLSGGGSESKNVTVNMDVTITANGEVDGIQMGGLYASGNGGDVENADVTLSAEINLTGSSSKSNINIGGLIGSYWATNTVSGATVDMDVSIKGKSASICVGGLMGNVWYAVTNLDNISTDVTLNISSGLSYGYGKYVDDSSLGGGKVYIDEATCSGTITVNGVS